MAEHNDYGRESEEKVTKFLAKMGYKILARNYKFQRGEVDIVALETKKARKRKDVLMSSEQLNEDVVVFVEVKARHSQEYGSPSEAVGQTKQKMYNLVANEFMKKKKLKGMPFRFDIVEVLGNEVVNHIENGF